MNRARAFVNDAFRGGAGRILTNQAPFTTEYLNSALEELQDKISNNGVITLIRDNVILTPITALATVDPSVQIQVAYNGFYNGSEWVTSPMLPPTSGRCRRYGSGKPARTAVSSHDAIARGFAFGLPDQLVKPLGVPRGCDLHGRFDGDRRPTNPVRVALPVDSRRQFRGTAGRTPRLPFFQA